MTFAVIKDVVLAVLALYGAALSTLNLQAKRKNARFASS